MSFLRGLLTGFEALAHALSEAIDAEDDAPGGADDEDAARNGGAPEGREGQPGARAGAAPGADAACNGDRDGDGDGDRDGDGDASEPGAGEAAGERDPAPLLEGFYMQLAAGDLFEAYRFHYDLAQLLAAGGRGSEWSEVVAATGETLSQRALKALRVAVRSGSEEQVWEAVDAASLIGDAKTDRSIAGILTGYMAPFCRKTAAKEADRGLAASRALVLNLSSRSDGEHVHAALTLLSALRSCRDTAVNMRCNPPCVSLICLKLHSDVLWPALGKVAEGYLEARGNQGAGSRTPEQMDAALSSDAALVKLLRDYEAFLGACAEEAAPLTALAAAQSASAAPAKAAAGGAGDAGSAALLPLRDLCGRLCVAYVQAERSYIDGSCARLLSLAALRLQAGRRVCTVAADAFFVVGNALRRCLATGDAMAVVPVTAAALGLLSSSEGEAAVFGALTDPRLAARLLSDFEGAPAAGAAADGSASPSSPVSPAPADRSLEAVLDAVLEEAERSDGFGRGLKEDHYLILCNGLGTAHDGCRDLRLLAQAKAPPSVAEDVAARFGAAADGIGAAHEEAAGIVAERLFEDRLVDALTAPIRDILGGRGVAGASAGEHGAKAFAPLMDALRRCGERYRAELFPQSFEALWRALAARIAQALEAALLQLAPRGAGFVQRIVAADLRADGGAGAGAAAGGGGIGWAVNLLEKMTEVEDGPAGDGGAGHLRAEAEVAGRCVYTESGALRVLREARELREFLSLDEFGGLSLAIEFSRAQQLLELLTLDRVQDLQAVRGNLRVSEHHEPCSLSAYEIRRVLTRRFDKDLVEKVTKHLLPEQ